jgi:hypothetical protein
MIKTICCVAFASSLFAIPNASAGQPRTHDGFFMRLSGGVSYANTTVESDNKNEVKFEDFGGHGNFAIGGMIGRNLALHGTVWGWDIADGDVAINGQEDNTNLDINLGAVGGGLTYYFEPSNIYVSGSLGIGKINFSTIFEDTDMGFAVEALLGKEWWVGNSWGLGVAGNFNYHSLPSNIISVPEDTFTDNWNGLGFGILFSATMN